MNIQAPPLVRKKLTLPFLFSIFYMLLMCFFCFPFVSTELEAAKLEWGNTDHLGEILQKHCDGFDLILGADIYILLCSVWFWFNFGTPMIFFILKR